MTRKKNILITGASKGVGSKIVKKLLDLDCNVYGISRSQTEFIDSTIKNFPNFFYKQVDLSNPEQAYLKIFKEDFITNNVVLDGFVNNAAIAYDDIITNMKLADLDNMFKVNVYSPFLLTKYALRNFIFNKNKGSIIHISSISVHTGYKGLSMYAASKGALEAFSKNTSREWGERGIRSNCLVAGFMDTEMSSSLDDSQRNRIYNRTSLKKPTDTDSVASTVAFLLSEEAKSITGQNIFVDSGTI
jgi:3-oxoacyl-[acyl-carrier protein] reductase